MHLSMPQHLCTHALFLEPGVPCPGPAQCEDGAVWHTLRLCGVPRRFPRAVLVTQCFGLWLVAMQCVSKNHGSVLSCWGAAAVHACMCTCCWKWLAACARLGAAATRVTVWQCVLMLAAHALTPARCISCTQLGAPALAPSSGLPGTALKAHQRARCRGVRAAPLVGAEADMHAHTAWDACQELPHACWCVCMRCWVSGWQLVGLRLMRGERGRRSAVQGGVG